MGVTMQGSVERMQRMVQAVANPKTVLRAVGAEAIRLVTKGFESEKAPSGEAWAPFARVHVKTKRFEGEVPTREGKVLNKTGKLKRSFDREFGPNTVAIYTDAPYAKTHQYGARIKGKAGGRLAFRVGGPWGRKFRAFAKEVTIPARPMLPIGGVPMSPEWRWRILFVVERTLKARLDNAR